ncbi:hypothetical protein C8R43DRAFT_1121524 [Mycena crocata]|nr:hypothetical protein C8R43DRAFT_1121524 [Mycena crocata]
MANPENTTKEVNPRLFAEPLFEPDLEETHKAHYVHINFPSIFNDTSSLRDIQLHRILSQETKCIPVDLDGVEHSTNPEGLPSPHGTISFNAYDILAPRRKPADGSWDYDHHSIYTPKDGVNAAAPYNTYRHIAEALVFYVLLWCVSGVPSQTMGWMELMWDAEELLKKVEPGFEPLVGEWLRPTWLLVSEAQFMCRHMLEKERSGEVERHVAL